MCLNVDPTLPDPGNDGTCCIGASLYGPGGCTCWRTVHDVEQQPVDPIALMGAKAGLPPPTRPSMCHDCAYRPGSPEKAGDPTMAGDSDALEDYAASGARFYCHQGVRCAVRREHPDGVVHELGPGAYDPPMDARVVWKADGSPGELCAGWDARRRALAARAALSPSSQR